MLRALTAPELIFPASAAGHRGDVRHRDHYPGTKRVLGAQLHFPSQETTQGSGSLSAQGIIRAAGGGGGSLGNGLCLILPSSLVCRSGGFAHGVPDTSCHGGDTKGCGLGGAVLVCTTKAMRRASKTGLSYKLQGCFFIVRARRWDPCCCFLPSCRPFPASSQACS